jgi:hypothetical protein
MQSGKLITAFAALGMLLTSCASSYQMYSGRVLPNDAVAILRQSGAGPALVISVDGKPCHGGRTYAGIGYNKWELLPGTHHVEVNLMGFYGGVRTSGPQTVTFTAAPGQVYDVSHKARFVRRSGFSDVYLWAPVIIRQHPVTDADRVKANTL